MLNQSRGILTIHFTLILLYVVIAGVISVETTKSLVRDYITFTAVF